MKVAIVTLPLHTNYGGILQAFALQRVLENLGHEVEHLQPVPVRLHPKWKLPLVWCKRFIMRLFYKEKGLPVFMHPIKWIRKNTDDFIAKHINCRYVNYDCWDENIALGYDVVIFGSDQIWRPPFVPFIEHYFGSFLQKTTLPRFSYAASFGTDKNEFTEKQQRICGELLRDFSAVSVREIAGIDMCKSMFGVEPVQVLDPTFLLSREDYISLFEQVIVKKSSGNLAVYILDENPTVSDFIDRMAKQFTLIPFRTNSRVEDSDASIYERQQPPVEEWLRSFYDAELVITDSFHACVFSIIFKKPFICVGNKSRGSARFHTLLSLFGVEDRLVNVCEMKDYIPKPIDWNRVDSILYHKKRDAYNYLETALGNK